MSDGEGGILRAERGRVLVVDDDVDVCALLEVRLAGRGFEVARTTSAVAALDTLATAEVDVVLTDIKMARMSGLELCERIVASRPDLPVVVMTAFGTLEAAIAAIRVGAYDFVTKPVEIDALVIALGRAVEQRVRGSLPAGARGHALPRRGRRSAAAAPAAPPARAPGALGAAGRGGPRGPGRRAHRRGHQPRPRGGRRGGPPARGSLLPLERHPRRAAAAARARTRHPASRAALRRPVRPADDEAGVRPLAGGGGAAARLRLARERPRAAELPGARGGAGRRRARRGGRPAGGHPHLPPRARGGRRRRPRGAGHAC